jgi:hypothetical protein
MRLPGFRGETASDRVEFAAAQRTYQVAPDCDLISLAARKALLCQGIDPPIKRSTNLGAETCARKLGTFAGDQPPDEPGRPFRRYLLFEVQIRAIRCRPLASSKRRSSTIPPIGPSLADSMSGSFR